MIKPTRLITLGVMTGMAVLLTACASQPAPQGGPAFIGGLWHGFIAPISFVISLFDDSVRMYAFPNAGRWYDFGFLLGLSAWGGGAAASGR